MPRRAAVLAYRYLVNTLVHAARIQFWLRRSVTATRADYRRTATQARALPTRVLQVLDGISGRG